MLLSSNCIEAGLQCMDAVLGGLALLQSEFEGLLPVILERKLDAIIIDVKAVAEVNPPSKHNLTPNCDFRDGVVQQIRGSVVTLMEIRWLLRVGVLDVQ